MRLVTRLSSYFLLVLPAMLLAGCSVLAPPPTGPGSLADGPRDIRANRTFTTLRPAAQGRSYGLKLFGLIPLSEPTYGNATVDLYAQAQVPVEGKPVALANVSREEGLTNFLLFSLTSKTVTGDVVELGPPAVAVEPSRSQ